MARSKRDQHGAEAGDTGPAHSQSIPEFELANVVGHLLRRAQQIHATRWARHVPGGITSPQYAVLHALARAPGIDQVRLGTLASLDRSTTADIVRRLVARGCIHRDRSPSDARRYVLHLTDSGEELLRDTTGPALEVNEALLEPLTERQAATLVRLLQQLVESNGTALWRDEVAGADEG